MSILITLPQPLFFKEGSLPLWQRGVSPGFQEALPLAGRTPESCRTKAGLEGDCARESIWPC